MIYSGSWVLEYKPFLKLTSLTNESIFVVLPLKLEIVVKKFNMGLTDTFQEELVSVNDEIVRLTSENARLRQNIVSLFAAH